MNQQSTCTKKRKIHLNCYNFKHFAFRNKLRFYSLIGKRIFQHHWDILIKSDRENSDDSVNNIAKWPGLFTSYMLLENCPKDFLYFLLSPFSFSAFHNAMWRWRSTLNHVTFHMNIANERTNLIFSHFYVRIPVFWWNICFVFLPFFWLSRCLSNLATGVMWFN